MSTVRKRRLDQSGKAVDDSAPLDLTRVATIAYSSEHPAHPVEHLLDERNGPGGSRWRHSLIVLSRSWSSSTGRSPSHAWSTRWRRRSTSEPRRCTWRYPPIGSGRTDGYSSRSTRLARVGP